VEEVHLLPELMEGLYVGPLSHVDLPTSQIIACAVSAKDYAALLSHAMVDTWSSYFERLRNDGPCPVQSLSRFV
jgi:hypothetical protein